MGILPFWGQRTAALIAGSTIGPITRESEGCFVLLCCLTYVFDAGRSSCENHLLSQLPNMNCINLVFLFLGGVRMCIG